MADMVIGYLMDQAAAAAWVGHAAELHGLSDPDNVAASLVQPELPSRDLPPPLFEGNFGNYTTLCLMEDRVQQQVSFNQVSKIILFPKVSLRMMWTCLEQGSDPTADGLKLLPKADGYPELMAFSSVKLSSMK